MCTQFRPSKDDIFEAMDKERVPFLISDEYLSFEVSQEEEVDDALDSLLSGYDEDDDPVFTIEHIEQEIPSLQTKMRPV